MHSCDVTALEDTEVCVINYDKFEEAATSMRSMGAHVLKMLSREIVRQHGVMLLWARCTQKSVWRRSCFRFLSALNSAATRAVNLCFA